MSFESDKRAQDAGAAIEGLLETLPGRTPTGECLDAETAAAWVERTLLPHEVAAVEIHVADCTRCQELVAMVVRTTPLRETPEAAPLVTRWRFGWLVPVGAVAAAVIVWVAVGRETTPVFQEQTVQRYDAAPAPPVQTPASSPREPARSDQASAAVSERAAPDARAKLDALQKTEPAEVRQAAAADSAAAKEKASSAAETAAAAAPPVESASAARAAPAAGARSRADARLLAAPPQVEVVSADGTTRWRVASGAIERSTDGGRTWSAASIDAASGITAGASASPTVCWMVGRAGLVMLTTDGVTWRRLPFPALVDLTSVRPASARAAVVVAANGQQFETADGGAAWR